MKSFTTKGLKYKKLLPLQTAFLYWSLLKRRSEEEVAQKVAAAASLKKPKKSPNIWGYFCMKICSPELLKIYQSGHPEVNLRRHPKCMVRGFTTNFCLEGSDSGKLQWFRMWQNIPEINCLTWSDYIQIHTHEGLALATRQRFVIHEKYFLSLRYRCE